MPAGAQSAGPGPGPGEIPPGELTVDDVLRPPPVARGRRPRRPGRRRRLPGWLLAWFAGLAIFVVVGPFVYIHVIEGKAPPPLRLPVGPGGTTGPVNGTWVITSPSEAGYRVTEILFGQRNVAVGRTSTVSGRMTITGATVTGVHVSVDVRTIHSNAAGRDVTFRDSIMDTSAHPDADFTLTRAVDLGSVPGPGRTVTEQVRGNLSLRGVTRPVTFSLHARRDGARIVVQGSIPIRFALWHIPDPSFAITKVGSEGTVEMLLYFRRTA